MLYNSVQCMSIVRFLLRDSNGILRKKHIFNDENLFKRIFKQYYSWIYERSVFLLTVTQNIVKIGFRIPYTTRLYLLLYYNKFLITNIF